MCPIVTTGRRLHNGVLQNDGFAIRRRHNFMLLGMARYGDWICQYYRIAGATHHGTRNTLPREELRRLLAGNIICAKQRLDGFVSLDAAYTGGWITTPPIRFEGSRLDVLRGLSTCHGGAFQIPRQPPARIQFPV